MRRPTNSARRHFVSTAIGAPLAASMSGASAQAAFPSKPVRIVLPFAPGGAGDSVARVLSEKLADMWGQPVLVENKPGASGIVATQTVQQAPPDGHVVTLASFQHGVNPHVFKKLPYDTLKDFTAISQVANTLLILVANPAAPFKTVRELVAYARQNPGKVNYGTAGSGSSLHLATSLLSALAGIDMVQVAYKGSGPMLVGLLAGEVPVSFDGLISSLPHVRAGKLRALGMGSTTRTPLLPEVPTIAEAGVPGFECSSWLGIVGPANMPAPVVAKWQGDVARVLATPAVRDSLVNRGIEPIGSTPAEFNRFIQSEMAKWGDVVKRAGIQPS